MPSSGEYASLDLKGYLEVGEGIVKPPFPDRVELPLLLAPLPELLPAQEGKGVVERLSCGFLLSSSHRTILLSSSCYSFKIVAFPAFSAHIRTAGLLHLLPGLDSDAEEWLAELVPALPLPLG